MLSQKEKVDLLSKSSTYPHEVVSKIQVIETNISWVFLTGNYVYKMKKKIKFGEILDFSTLQKRKEACNNEIKFNKRLAPSLYITTVELNENLKIDGKGLPLEYLVKMHQLKQEDLLFEIVKRGEILEDSLIIKLATTIFEFHKKNIISPTFSVYEAIYEKWDENFRTTHDYPNFPFDLTLEKRVYSYLNENRDYFEQRGLDEKIVDGHGDLILANMFKVGDNVIIFDCIEFNELLRVQDVFEEICFLAMDLDFHGLKKESDLLISTYLKLSDENLPPDAPILNFYKSYRAYVRAKVYFSQSLQEQDMNTKSEIESLAVKYMQLASSYRF